MAYWGYDMMGQPMLIENEFTNPVMAADVLRDRDNAVDVPGSAPAVVIDTGSSPTWRQTLGSIPGALADTFGLSDRPGAQTAATTASEWWQSGTAALGTGVGAALSGLLPTLVIIAVVAVSLAVISRRA